MWAIALPAAILFLLETATGYSEGFVAFPGTRGSGAGEDTGGMGAGIAYLIQFGVLVLGVKYSG